MWTTFCVIILIVTTIEAKPPRTDVTVSGLSSGGAMAAQLHLAYSSVFSGSGIVAGPPYYCAQGTMIAAVTECLYGPAMLIPVAKLEAKLQSYVESGSADPTSHLKNDPVYIFSGTNDHTVVQDVVKINEQIFSSVGAKIQTNYGTPANHGFVTDNYGGLCAMLNFPQYINNWYVDKKKIRH
jgi:poly(3-hydroxybutyrate) depolymerase